MIDVISNLIQPKEMEFDTKKFIISKFPAVSGREIIAKYPLSGLPKVGEYAVNEETMLKLMNYVAVSTNENNILRLSSRSLVDAHVSSWEVLARVEMAMIEYNCSFFQNGRVSTFLEDIVQNLPEWISKILTNSLQQLSQTAKPRSTS